MANVPAFFNELGEEIATVILVSILSSRRPTEREVPEPLLDEMFHRESHD
jgi:hypothetical protein